MLHRLVFPDTGERQALRAEILHRASFMPTSQSHNAGGWQSTRDLFTWALSPVAWLRRSILTGFTTLGLSVNPGSLRGWAIVNRRGSFHRRHIHARRYAWSGIYYVDPGGDQPAHTIIEVGDDAIAVKPETGMAVIFPANLWHSTEPHNGQAERVTVAFDVARQL